MVMVLWTLLFLDQQGHAIERNIIYQDHQSAILLEMNGLRSAGSKAWNVQYFFVTDNIEKGTVEILYCLTDKMTRDFMTNPYKVASTGCSMERSWV